MSKKKTTIKQAERRSFRVRDRLKRDNAGVPRVSVFRSSKHMYAQLIDDANHATLASASSLTIKVDGDKKAVAREIGKQLAQKAKDINISTAVFDRGSYRYHGRVQELADGLRDGGLSI